MTKLTKKQRHQVKSRWYYIFWGAATVSVFAGQLYVGSGYRQMSKSFDRIVDDNNYFSIQYSYLKEITDNNMSLSFNSLWFDFSVYKNLFSFPYQLNLFLSKTFFESSNLNSLDENLMYGLSLKLNIYKNLFFLTEFRNTYYDQNIDGKIDRISYINTGLKIKF